MQTPTQLRTSNKLLVPIVLLVIDGLFNILSFFIPLISLSTGHLDGIARPIPVIVVVLVLSVVSLIAAWGLGKRQRWARTAGPDQYYPPAPAWHCRDHYSCDGWPA